jgi:enamine deaminase RidA (YjgF/YER057c/UK114 family)
MDPDERLEELGIELPPPMAAMAAYQPAVGAGELLAIAGQGPVRDGQIVTTGRLGDGLSVEEGYEAARLTGMNVLSVARDHLGSLSAIEQVVQATVYVAATHAFTDHPAVADGATELFEQVLGDAGKPARAGVGVASLPMGIPVEVETLLRVDRR